MTEPNEAAELDPILQPRAIRFLKKRDRLIDMGMREEFLDEMEDRVVQRRRPDVVAEKTVKKAFNETAEAAAPPMRRRVFGRLTSANEGILENF